jgi:hypothetical protein
MVAEPARHADRSAWSRSQFVRYVCRMCQDRPRSSDYGGVWVATGVVLGLMAYGAVILMLIAGYTSVLPVVILPPVLAGLIGASNLMGGGRTYGRTPGRPVGYGQAPLSSSGPNGPLAAGLETAKTSEDSGDPDSGDSDSGDPDPGDPGGPGGPEDPGDPGGSDGSATGVPGADNADSARPVTPGEGS